MGNTSGKYTNFKSFNDEKIRVLNELGRDLNEDVLGQVLALHFETTEKIVNDLRLALEKKDYPALAQLAHKFKSNCAQVGLERLHAIATDLEHVALQPSVCELTLQYIMNHLHHERISADATLSQFGKVG